MSPSKRGGRPIAAIVKFSVFAVVMLLTTAGLVIVFDQWRSGPTSDYKAVFTDVSGLKAGDTVRIAGIRVGTVTAVDLGLRDHKVTVGFDSDSGSPLTRGTRAQVRYLNLTGDRYLELADGPGSAARLPKGGTIPQSQTSPALNLDQLIGGFKPLIRVLDPDQSNALTASLVQILQGQGGTLVSLLSNTSSFTSTLADNDRLIGEVITNLRTVLDTIAKNGDQFSDTIGQLDSLVNGLAAQRTQIGRAVGQIDSGTASLASLLQDTRPNLTQTINNLSILAPTLQAQRGIVDSALQKAPENFRKVARLGSYGNFFNFYLCGVSVNLTGLDGKTVKLPWVQQQTGRCSFQDE
ncbi:MlaD family protein [uncultured Williamsia sp.]|uniref:MCE family protein n=1 Tax=uncultured Williamsia sp. TaxID=259311 RepID=UPI002616DD5D|nr:MlaD family protein [uncultured Williamsia sp.]